jgi:hypothetical protein
VASLFASADLQLDGVVPWGFRIPRTASGTSTGIYVVALTDNADTTEAAIADCPISRTAIHTLLEVRPELMLDGTRPDAASLAERLTSFWLPSEVVLYVGLAGPRKRMPTAGELAKRVGEYYATPLGARAPHAGGWPLKTLAGQDQLAVHYAYCEPVDERERLMLAAFAANVDPDERAALADKEHVMPFANLEYPPGTRKLHGISGAKASRRS